MNNECKYYMMSDLSISTLILEVILELYIIFNISTLILDVIIEFYLIFDDSTLILDGTIELYIIFNIFKSTLILDVIIEFYIDVRCDKELYISNHILVIKHS